MKYPKGIKGKLDKQFSLFIRKRDRWTCQRCKKKYPEKARGLHCSHYMGRTNMATRWDEENCDALCHGCHSYFEDRKQTAYRDWKIEKHGLSLVERVEVKSRELFKPIPIELNELHDKLKKSNES